MENKDSDGSKKLDKLHKLDFYKKKTNWQLRKPENPRQAHSVIDSSSTKTDDLVSDDRHSDLQFLSTSFDNVPNTPSSLTVSARLKLLGKLSEQFEVKQALDNLNRVAENSGFPNMYKQDNMFDASGGTVSDLDIDMITLFSQEELEESSSTSIHLSDVTGSSSELDTAKSTKPGRVKRYRHRDYDDWTWRLSTMWKTTEGDSYDGISRSEDNTAPPHIFHSPAAGTEYSAAAAIPQAPPHIFHSPAAGTEYSAAAAIPQAPPHIFHSPAAGTEYSAAAAIPQAPPHIFHSPAAGTEYSAAAAIPQAPPHIFHSPAAGTEYSAAAAIPQAPPHIFHSPAAGTEYSAAAAIPQDENLEFQMCPTCGNAAKSSAPRLTVSERLNLFRECTSETQKNKDIAEELEITRAFESLNLNARNTDDSLEETRKLDFEISEMVSPRGMEWRKNRTDFCGKSVNPERKKKYTKNKDSHNKLNKLMKIMCNIHDNVRNKDRSEDSWSMRRSQAEWVPMIANMRMSEIFQAFSRFLLKSCKSVKMSGGPRINKTRLRRARAMFDSSTEDEDIESAYRYARYHKNHTRRPLSH